MTRLNEDKADKKTSNAHSQAEVAEKVHPKEQVTYTNSKSHKKYNETIRQNLSK